MVIHEDFSISAENLSWVGPSELTNLGGGLFQTPDKFFEQTLLVMFRGLPLARENEDGYTIVDEQTFELKEPQSSALDWYMVGYVKKPF